MFVLFTFVSILLFLCLLGANSFSLHLSDLIVVARHYDSQCSGQLSDTIAISSTMLCKGDQSGKPNQRVEEKDGSSSYLPASRGMLFF
jgi:hypothetical protein